MLVVQGIWSSSWIRGTRCSVLQLAAGYRLDSVRRYVTSPLELRDYQQHVIDKCIQRITQGNECKQVRLGVSLATGGGKTVIFSNLIKQLVEMRRCEMALILVHRRELVQQAAATVRRFMPSCRILIEMGKATLPPNTIKSKEFSTVVIASVQSLIRRLDKYSSDAFDVIIIDEAHHAVADSYMRVLDHFDSKIPVVGFSATFERADNKALSTVMDEIIYHRGILEMINDKWLCEGVFTQVDVDYDLSNVDISKVTNDFKIDKLARIMNTEHVNEAIVKTYIHKSTQSPHSFSSTLLFAVDIDHVNSLQKTFERYNVKAAAVTSMTKTDERDRLIREFKMGNIQVLINCGIFTEGTDMPNIDCILLCRPTRSRSLLIQMIGRGLRLHDSKTHCNIIDFIGASDVGVVSTPTLVGIDHRVNTLEDATIEDLLKIKNEFDLKQKHQVEKELAAETSFQSFLDRIDAFDLTLSSFDSFQSYHDHSSKGSSIVGASNSSNELEIFFNSKYPWVRFAEKAWAMPLQKNHHLRIYKKDSNYSLKLYREIPFYLRESTSTRFIPKDLIVDQDIFKIFGKVEEVIRNLTDSKTNNGIANNFTKFAKWRYEPATVRQRNFIQTKLKARSNEYGVEDRDIDNFIQGLKKGQASNILFTCNLAPVYPIKSLLRILKYRIKS